MTERKSGVLMHISSLMGNYGIGTFGKNAKRFIDFLQRAGFHYWQVLPFTGIDACHSPYKSDSAFAGNFLFLDPESLWEQGLLSDKALEACRCPDPYTTAYEWLIKTRPAVFRSAFAAVGQEYKHAIAQFFEENKSWLYDYSVYMAVKETTGLDWCNWEDGPLKRHEPKAVGQAATQYAELTAYYVFLQYLFDRQWREIKTYANAHDVAIIGDMPIYVSLESADVWSHRELFELDPAGNPVRVAGVPPDYFTADGQKWGNPLYRWDRMKQDSYRWWESRLGHTMRWFDLIRIDHFRAFSAYWAVPFEAPTAKGGCWENGPGYPFFEQLFKTVPREKIIAEDLGAQDPQLTALLKETGLPGMRVMQFGFLEGGDSPHLPHNYSYHTAAYTGTHDNTTLLAYLWELSPEQREYCLRYCGFEGNDWKTGGSHSEAIRAILRTLWASHSRLVLAPIQDLCGFGGDTRMNYPGTIKGNWGFRLTEQAFSELDIPYLRALNELYRRIS